MAAMSVFVDSSVKGTARDSWSDLLLVGVDSLQGVLLEAIPSAPM